MPNEIDTTNDFLIGTDGDLISFFFAPQVPMSKEKALRTAAWLVALADPLEKEWPVIYNAVRNI